MPLENCLILAAGFGTRMGKIGQTLPKVMWPVFEKTLLELQVLYARNLGAKKIFINLHHQKEQIKKYIQSNNTFKDVILLEEDPILDIGGGIHNLARRENYQGSLLVLNADQFFWISQADLSSAMIKMDSAPALLFNFNVNTSDGYNQVEIDQKSNMIGIIKNKDLPANKIVQTYTGMSVVNLSSLKKIDGVTNFFDSVATYSLNEIPTVLLDNPIYWDFGTLSRYWKSMFNIIDSVIRKTEDNFINFLFQVNALDRKKINLLLHSYDSNGISVINLSGKIISKECTNKIFLNDNNLDGTKDQIKQIVYDGECVEDVIS